MADFEHARAMLLMAHKDFNALTGMLDSSLKTQRRPKPNIRGGGFDGRWRSP